MRSKIVCSAVAMACLFTVGEALGQSAPAAHPKAAAPAAHAAPAAPAARSRAAAPQPADAFVIVAGTQIPLELQSAVTTRTAYVGMPIYCRTLYPVTLKDRMVIPVGSWVKGTVTQVARPGRVHGKAKLGLRFDSLILPSGVTKDISGVLAGFAGNGKEGFKRQEGQIIGQGTKGRDVETVLISGAEGAGIGSVAGISGGHSGAGAATGGTIGALGGLVWVLATRGKEIVLPAGTDFQLETTRPITFYRYQIEPMPDPNGPTFTKQEPGPAM